MFVLLHVHDMCIFHLCGIKILAPYFVYNNSLVMTLLDNDFCYFSVLNYNNVIFTNFCISELKFTGDLQSHKIMVLPC